MKRNTAAIKYKVGYVRSGQTSTKEKKKGSYKISQHASISPLTLKYSQLQKGTIQQYLQHDLLSLFFKFRFTRNIVYTSQNTTYATPTLHYK